MPSAERTIVVDRRPDQVFAFFADPANDRAWRTHVKEIAALGPAGVGATIHQVIEGPGGRGLPPIIEITAYDPPTRYAFRVVAGPGSADRRVQVRPVSHRHGSRRSRCGRSSGSSRGWSWRGPCRARWTERWRRSIERSR